MQKKSIVKNAIYKILLNFFNLIVPIIIGAYVYRTLGSDAIGRVKTGETIFNYFFIFAGFGIYQYGMREVSRIKNDREKVNQLFTSLFTFSLLTNFLTLFVYVAVSYFGYGGKALFPVLMVYGVNFFLNIFYVEWVNEAYEDYGFITLKTMIVKIIYVILLLTFVKSSDNYLIFIALLATSTGLNNIISYFYVKRRVKFDFKDVRFVPHLKPLFLVVIFSNGNILYTQLDRFMLGQFVSERSVSYYTMAQQIATMINALMISLIQVTIPRLSFLVGSDHDEQYLSLLKRISKVYSALLFPAAIGLYVIANAAVVLYGKQPFAPAGPVLAIYALYMITIGFESIQSNQVIYIKKKENVLVWMIFVCGIANLIFKAVFLYFGKLNASSAILTTLFANLLLIAIEYTYIRKYLKVPFQLLSWSNLRYLVYSLIFIPIGIGFRHIFHGTMILTLSTMAVCGIVYLLILLATKDEIVILFTAKLKGRFLKG
ncbi:oligosaccharide flippase family protein [Bacillus sp. BRMEA1]|uniref:oligosaccharide flippase family protein n=1 Tax=Neobacillus endophyticus TaxID=2738405 RepID=UPI001567871B|nr:oligosaccharide flippase family protein [Neobacillus endophyticus]NRD76700.1 oligosaccharide flippase family protein [Neobacillus endophyticus]